MEKYDKEKLHEYAKELFALCLEKGLHFDYCNTEKQFTSRINGYYYWSFLDRYRFDEKEQYNIPIWELIEKVKQL